MVNRRRFFLTLFLFFTLVSLFSTPVLARIPEFTGNYNIDNKTPYINRRVTITIYINIHDPDGQEIPFGTLFMYLFWSRDKSTWVSEDMTPESVETYKGVIPTQDGSDNVRYNYGEGKLYWFIRMTNDAYETDTFYSSQSPNEEIFVIDPNSGLEPPSTEVDNGSIELPLLEIPAQIIRTIFDPTADPFVRIVLVLLVVAIVFVIASGGKGFGMLRGLFRK